MNVLAENHRAPWGWLALGILAWIFAYAKVVHAGGVPARAKVESWF